MPISDSWLEAHVKRDLHRRLLRRIIDGDETLNAAQFVTLLTDEASFRFGSTPAVVGKRQIQVQVEDFFKHLRSLRHEIEAVWEAPDLLVYEARVTYTTTSAQTLNLPYANVLRLQDALVHDYRIYIDTAPLMQR